MPCDTPRPERASSVETSCNPVPDAETMPMSPRGTALAKAIGTPAISAVPQSGPISSRPRSMARSFNATSSATGTLSENTIACIPASSALRASAAANSPGTEIRTRFALEMLSFKMLLSVPEFKNFSARTKAASAFFPLTAMMRSSGRAPSPSFVSRPDSFSSAWFDGVPIMRETAATPSPSLSCISRAMRISATESA